MKSYQNRRPTPAWPVPSIRRFSGRTWVACGVLLACGAAPIPAAEADPARTAPAKATVVAFLDAVKRGDDATARGLLTKVAAVKTEELGISVAPPVADSATYSVRDCEFVAGSGDLAHVATTWTEVGPDGSASSENVIWVVRLDPEGWRVVGMAMRVFDDMPPLLLNFEDPEDMVAKQEMVATELEKRAGQAADTQPAGSRTARGPATPTGARQ